MTAAQGGTGQSSYAVGDLLYASAANALSKLADVAVGQVLVSGGVGAGSGLEQAAPALTTSLTVPIMLWFRGIGRRPHYCTVPAAVPSGKIYLDQIDRFTISER